MDSILKFSIWKKAVRGWVKWAERRWYMFKILSVISVILFASCFTAKSIPKVHMKGSDAAMTMELTKLAYGITAIAVSKDGSYVLTADNGGGMANKYAKSTIRLWDISSGKLVKMVKTDSWINHLEFSPDGKHAALAGFGGSSIHPLKLLDLSSGKAVWESFPSVTILAGFLERVTFSPDGKYVLAPGNPASMIEVSTGKTVKTTEATFFTKGYVSGAVFSPDSRYILTGDTWLEEFKLLDAKTFKEIRKFKGHKAPFTIATPSFVPKSLSFSLDGRYAMSSNGVDDAVIIWDIETGKEIRRFTGFENVFMGIRVTASSFSPDGKSAFIHAYPTKIWDITSGEGRTILSRVDLQITTNPPNGASFNPNGRNVVLSYGDSGVRIVDAVTAKEVAMLVGFEDGEWIVITSEGYYNSSEKGAQYLSVKMGEKKYDTDLFYDVFYRPDIVMATLRGEDIKDLITITIEDAIKSPPPSVEFAAVPKDTDQSKVKVCYKARSTGGGIGEVRLFHNGKLVQSDGYYKDVAKSTTEKAQLLAMNSKAIYEDMKRGIAIKEKMDISPIASKSKGDTFEDCGEIDAISGENEVSLTAFNSNNTVQSPMKTISFNSKIPSVEPHLYILSVGIDQYKDSSVNLKYAVKDANDIKEKILMQASTLYKPQNIHYELLTDKDATKTNILNRVNELSSKIKAADSFILFVAGHGVLLQNQYFMLTHEYDGGLSDNILISANEIVEMSKKIKSLSQLLIFDTCHAGGVDYIVSGLYDARMSVLAKKMGLHIYASASSLQEAMDGYKGNGLFSHSLLDGLNNNRGADKNSDGKVSLVELGGHSKMTTVEISKKIGHTQTPLIINFGKDNAVYSLGR